MRRHLKRKVATEFELDLAPLLAVMVKLVPVLLLTTSFVQFSALNTQLPSAAAPVSSDPQTSVTMSLRSIAGGFQISVDQGSQTLESIKSNDIADVKVKVKELSAKHPDIKTFFLSPSNENSYAEMASLLELSPVKEVVLANVFGER